MTKKKKQTKPMDGTHDEIVYALRCKKCGKLLEMEKTSNDGGDFCGEFTVRLDHFCGDPDIHYGEVWYIDEAFNAEYVRQFSTEWYNSGERCPKHGYEPEDLEVVEVHRVVTTKKLNIKIPTYMEFAEIKYSKKEPKHLEYLKSEFEKRSHQDWHYSLYELMELIYNGKWNPEVK